MITYNRKAVENVGASVSYLLFTDINEIDRDDFRSSLNDSSLGRIR